MTPTYHPFTPDRHVRSPLGGRPLAQRHPPASRAAARCRVTSAETVRRHPTNPRPAPRRQPKRSRSYTLTCGERFAVYTSETGRPRAGVSNVEGAGAHARVAWPGCSWQTAAVGEARLRRTKNGLVPDGRGWFVLNARESRWRDDGPLGRFCTFEGKRRFPQIGINISVLQPS